MRHSVRAVPARSGHIIVQAILDLVAKLRQQPGFYPIRYYKKSRRTGKTRNSF